MRYGCCVGPDAITILAAAGFDFCELPASAVQPFDDDTTALPALRALAAAPLCPEVFNLLIPAALPLPGPHADLPAVRAYLRRAFGRMVALGGVVAVLGSGAARRIPDDLPRATALDGLADALALAGEEAARAGITLALEHLNRSECNVFNSVAECQTFIVERGLQGVHLLADLHHLALEHEPFANVTAAAPLLAHVHVADGGRRAPGGGGYAYAEFMQAVRAAGYDARISAECGWDDLAAEAPAALAFMQAQWEAV